MPVAPGQAGVRQEMHKFKHGQLHSGSTSGPVVTNRKQAIAIALNEAGLSKPTKSRKRSANGKSKRRAKRPGPYDYMDRSR